MNGITYIDEASLENQQILVRVDYNVSLRPDHQIADDLRITQSLPTLYHLLAKKNRLVLISHLGDPKGVESALSLQPVVERLQTQFPNYEVRLIKDYEEDAPALHNQKTNQIFLLENIRFWEGEEQNDLVFAESLAKFGTSYVNEAFSVSHRKHASVYALPRLLPSYGGLLLKKEVETITQIVSNPKKPVVAVLGGAKISTKIHLLQKLINIADTILIGGALANTFLVARDYSLGASMYEEGEVEEAEHLLEYAAEHNTKLLLPEDVIVDTEACKKINEVEQNEAVGDIGSGTIERYTHEIINAQTIIWNGPMGKFEKEEFSKGTNAIYNAIIANRKATSLVGGGDTIAAFAHQTHIDQISHVSTGGGAMLDLIENGTLPGLEALSS